MCEIRCYTCMKCHLYSLSELPECQVLLAKRTDVIDQVLAIALHPACACLTAAVAVSMILCLTQSPETHNFITWRDVVGKMLEICELTQKKINEQSSLSRPIKEDPAVVKALKYVIYPSLVCFSMSLSPLVAIISLSHRYDVHNVIVDGRPWLG